MSEEAILTPAGPLKTLRDYVEWYIANGFNIFPVAYKTKGVAPSGWKQFETRMQTPDEMRKAFEPYYETGEVNIGAVMGVTSKQFGTDIDSEDIKKKLDPHLLDHAGETTTVLSGSHKGFHYYYLSEDVIKSDHETYTPKNMQTKKGRPIKEGIHIQGQGTIVILPPSVHPESGKRYEFVKLVPPAKWSGPFHDTFKEIVEREYKLIKLPKYASEINVKRLLMGGYKKGDARPVRAFELLTWFRKNDYSEEDAWDEIQEWNATNDPPIDDEKLRAQLNWVYTHDLYSLRFTEKEAKIFSDKIIQKAKEILVSPNLEEMLDKALDSKIYREYNARKVAFYGALSAKMKTGEFKQIILIRGEPGGGKSHLANAIADFFLTLKRGRLSERAVDYMQKKIRDHELLYLMEFLGGEQYQEQGGVSTLKFLSMDDQGYTIEVTRRNRDTGDFETVEVKIPPITVLTTSIAVEIEKQFLRRCLSINVDDSEEQTWGILAFKAEKHINTILEKLGLKKEDELPKILDCVISLLYKDCYIAVWFSDTVWKILKMISPPKPPLRFRGDFDKLMTLIMMRAYFHQYQRPFQVAGKTKIIWALPEDLVAVLHFAKDTILEMTTGLEKRVVEAIPLVFELKDNQQVRGNEIIQGFTVEEFKASLPVKKSRETAYKILEKLVDAGILSSTSYGRGTNRIYSVVADKSDADSVILELSKTISDNFVESEAEKEFEEQISQVVKLSTEVNNARSRHVINTKDKFAQLTIYSPKTIQNKFWERIKVAYADNLTTIEIDDPFADLPDQPTKLSDVEIDKLGGSD